jgi:tripartite ATP-independent transporter DctP family solute receptor
MKRVKFLFAVVAMALLFVFLTGVQGAPKSYVIKSGHSHNTTHPYQIGQNLFKEIVEKNSKGRIKVEIFPAEQLGTEDEMLEQLKLGSLQTGIMGRYETVNPRLAAFALPFLFRNYQHVEKVLAGPVGKKYAKYAEEKGLKIIGWTHSGFRQITNNIRPITKPEDLKGLKMRTPPIETILQTMRALGANATMIEYGELYMALKTKVVDGEENPFANIYNEKFYETQKYMTVCNYIYAVSPMWVSLKWWNSLSAADRRLIQKAATAGCKLTNKITVESENELLKKLKAGGMEVYTLNDKEVKAFQAKVDSVYKWAIKQGYITKKIIKAIKNTK